VELEVMCGVAEFGRLVQRLEEQGDSCLSEDPATTQARP
jgi:hypothetical protein